MRQLPDTNVSGMQRFVMRLPVPTQVKRRQFSAFVGTVLTITAVYHKLGTFISLPRRPAVEVVRGEPAGGRVGASGLLCQQLRHGQQLGAHAPQRHRLGTGTAAASAVSGSLTRPGVYSESCSVSG